MGNVRQGEMRVPCSRRKARRSGRVERHDATQVGNLHGHFNQVSAMNAWQTSPVLDVTGRHAMSSSGHQPTTGRRRRFRSERGAAMLEAAMTLPLLLFVCIGIIEFGRLYQTWQVMTNAAREGARVAVLPTQPSVDARVRQYLQMGGLNSDNSVGVNVTAVPVSLGGGATASGSRVTVTYPFTFMVLQPIAQLVVSGSTVGAPITISTSATMRNETQF